MTGENPQTTGGQQPPHWLEDARDALSKRAGEHGQEWPGPGQEAYHDAPAGEWVNGEWVAHAHEGALGYDHDAHEAALNALNKKHEDAAASGVAALDLNDRDRLPWLETGEEDEDYYAVDTRRVIAAVVGGLLLLALIVGGIWAFTHRRGEGTPVADGSVIGGADQPYKQAPENPGGRKFEGTGDSSFAAAQGKDHPAQLAASDAPPVAKDAAKAAPAAKPDAPTKPAEDDAAPAGGVVQIAAYSNEAAARAGWDRLVQQHESLKGANHRIVQGQADIGTVYRLQLVTGAGGGAALCGKLKAEGVSCQVKH